MVAYVVLYLAACAAPAGAAPVACEALKAQAFEATTIASAELVAAGAFKPPMPSLPGPPPPNYATLPAFCRVTGSIRPTTDSDIRFEAWLPATGWNGKFVQVGNGGAAGSIVHNALGEVVARGYAAANTDMGHQGSGGDFSWALGHPEKVTDYAWRSFHLLTGVGKAITAAHYGRQPAKSYWYGCSTGGRQGLKEAQRFPEDYDGIVAGAPASNWAPLMSLAIEVQRNLSGSPADRIFAGDGLSKLALLKEGAIAACDAGDGVKDRVITDPRSCRFDPGSLACKAGETTRCLSAAEVDAARRIYRGVVDSKGKVWFPGTGPASELQWAAYVSPQFGIGTSYFRNLVAKDPSWSPTGFDVDRDVARIAAADGGTAAMDPDLGRFIARGGKLVTYHGTTDGLIPFGNSVNYFDSVVAKLGTARVKDSVRFYAVPGMDHCSGGEGAFDVDWLGALDRWIETGRAPDALSGSHPAVAPSPLGGPPAKSTPYTRPICPWPQLPKYNGSGDTTDAANFKCAAP
jgi:feruloyl esterase